MKVSACYCLQLGNSVQEALGFIPFELVFGLSVHVPFKLLKENWLSENTESLNLLHYVSKFRSKFKKDKRCFGPLARVQSHQRHE